jgi:hypothetical protein
MRLPYLCYPLQKSQLKILCLVCILFLSAFDLFLGSKFQGDLFLQLLEALSLVGRFLLICRESLVVLLQLPAVVQAGHKNIALTLQ